jgi:ribosomal protein S18 acetylase RimI-like enzyme
MTVLSRPYAGISDLHALIQLLSEQRSRNSVQRWHVGDLIWRTFYSSLFDPTENVRLWHTENGNLVGFGWRYSSSAVDLYSADVALLPEMIAWAQACAGDEPLYVVTLDWNEAEIAVLEASGFAAEPAYAVHLRRKLRGEISRSVLPAGFILRPLAGVAEVEARALLHRQAFDSNAVTDEGYHNVIRAPLYQPELDLVIVAPDGRLAAFCLCWLDEPNKVGLFEPVGAHPDFRRMGLARAVMLEGLRRMQARGMESAIITSIADNTASRTLYNGLGFTELESHELVYKREKNAANE